MANSAKNAVYGCLLASALGGAQACAHQMEGDIAEPDVTQGSGRGGSDASSAGRGGTVSVVPTATAGKGGTSPGSGGKGGSGGSGNAPAEGGAGGEPEDAGGSGGSGDVGGEPAPDTGFSVQYMASQTEDTSVAISCQFKVNNGSAETVSLSEFTLRYYFTDELNVTPALTMFWARLTTGGDFAVTLSKMDMTPATHADSYIEFAFGTGAATMLAPGQSAELAWQSHNDQGEINIQTNDYSFDASKTQYTDWQHVVLLRNGEPYWGTPP